MAQRRGRSGVALLAAGALLFCALPAFVPPLNRRAALAAPAAAAMLLLGAETATADVSACNPGANNCWSTLSTDKTKMSPWKWPAGTSKADAVSQLKAAIDAYPQAGQGEVDLGGYSYAVDTLADKGYARLEFKSGIGNFARFFNGGQPFVDDFEVSVGDSSVAVKSASRLGDSDFGVNAKRCNYIAAALRAKGWEFAFDGVFGEQSAQRDVFMQIGLPVLREALRGINGTVLAYGQTGSGKAGLLPRLVASLSAGLQFLMISQDVANVYDIEAAAVQGIASLPLSHQQIYNEQVDDLLNCEHQSGIGHNLNVRDGGIVNGLTWIRCTKPDEMLAEAFTRARANVVYAETKMNKANLIAPSVQGRGKRERVFEAAKTGQKVECTIARLNVVDLAGSERATVKKSGSEGMRFQASNVVSALAARKSHIPLRDSKLTRILDGSIGGNCRTALLVCVNPAFEHVGETQNTLEFASRAMRVEVDAKVNTALVEVSAKVQADKKEIEAKREAEKREKAVQEAESNVKKLQQAVFTVQLLQRCAPGATVEVSWALRATEGFAAGSIIVLVAIMPLGSNVAMAFALAAYRWADHRRAARAVAIAVLLLLARLWQGVQRRLYGVHRIRLPLKTLLLQVPAAAPETTACQGNDCGADE
ncbi:Kinesin-like protein KIF18B [Symbiodinium microadriaticum]|uniref:Kinesin-like protein n=1 Tax=Symbiodinium microadriaticum TaxID=2951 RepID=A0A1Q9DSX9_SYMMI|nr:Kinesin-like protein KIF18B [Symbiodinium microadriaticum]